MNKSASYQNLVIVIQSVSTDSATYLTAYGDSTLFTWKAHNVQDRCVLSTLEVGGKYWVNVNTNGRGVQNWLGVQRMVRQLKGDTPRVTAKVQKELPKSDKFVEF